MRNSKFKNVKSKVCRISNTQTSKNVNSKIKNCEAQICAGRLSFCGELLKMRRAHYRCEMRIWFLDLALGEIKIRNFEKANFKNVKCKIQKCEKQIRAGNLGFFDWLLKLR